MTLRNARALRFSPAGVSDALAEEGAFPGACTSLSNLIPDPSTKNLWTPRPASISKTTFGSFTSPTGVTVFKVVGNYVYGMISSGHFAGKDEPFAWNLLTSAFLTVTGVTSGTCPTTQATTGEWTPPTMDMMGTFLVVTHPGFDGVTNFIGWFDLTNPAAPIWHAGNFLLVTPMSGVTIVDAGSGYTNGTYTLVPSLGGSGAGAELTVVVSGNAVTSVTVTNGGVGYTVGDTIGVSSLLIGTAGSGFVGQVSSVIGSAILLVNLTGVGTNYANGTYTGVHLVGGSGSGAQATIIVSATQVNSVAITNGGGGYVVGDVLYSAGGAILTFNNGALVGGSGYTDGTYNNVMLSGGSGNDATGNVTVAGGAVTACTINQGGAGFKVGDIVSSGGGGVGTVVQAGSPAGPGYAGTYTNIVQDQGYPVTVDPSWTTNGVGVGSIFSVTLDANGYITSFVVNKAGSNFLIGDLIAINIASGGIVGVGVQITGLVGTGPLAGGSGFSATVATVSAIPIGNSGSGFNVQVATVAAPGGYINFTTVPSFVRQFNGRSWFGINPPTGEPSVIFSDVYALNCTNATQSLQFGDNSILTAAAPLPLSNLLGGIVQSLIIFKAANGIIQITGDATTGNLNVNQVPGGSGTQSPRSLSTHPQGLLYLDHDGYRMIDMEGSCTDPIGVSGQGVSLPLLNPTTRSRVNAACNGSVLRVSLQNSLLAGVWQEYWFDLTRKLWSGPHTFPSTMIDQWNQDFVITPAAVPASLWTSAIQPEGVPTFVENSVTLSWVYQTTVLLDNNQMAESEITEMQVKTTPGATMTTMTVKILDQDAAAIATTTYTYGSILGLAARSIVFSAPVVYNRAAIQVTGVSSAGFQIGDVWIRARMLGYLQPVA